MRPWKRIATLILIILVFVSASVICIQQQNISEKGEIAYTNISIEECLLNNLNSDGGYHDIPNLRLYDSDKLYYTYYSLQCLECVDNRVYLEDRVFQVD